MPAKIISPSMALTLAALLILCGLAILVLELLPVTLFLGLFNIFWYNIFYTRLKRVTPFAVVPGALTGAIPILMGWTAAGGYIFSPEALLLAGFLFLWQVPHFWLLMLQYGDEYKIAGLPVVSDVFTPGQIRSVTFAWLVASSIASLMLLHFRVFHSLYAAIAVIILSVILILLAVHQFFITRSKSYRFLFLAVNSYLLLVMVLLVAERL